MKKLTTLTTLTTLTDSAHLLMQVCSLWKKRQRDMHQHLGKLMPMPD